MNKENMKEVSFEELWGELSGSTDFGQDELIEMLSCQDDQGENFYIYHRHKAFCVPLYKIKEFFTKHAKPIPPMTKDQELVYLREKVKKLQDDFEARMGEGKMAKPAPDETEALVKEPEEAEPFDKSGDVLEPIDDGGSSNFVGTVEKVTGQPVPPKRDESIPPPGQREKKSLKEIQADLAKELKGAKAPKKKVTDSAKSKDISGREGLVDTLLKNK